MQRVLTTATLVGLLIATAAAFAITERLKLVKSPIYGTRISPVLSPTCSCARGKAKISLKFRHADHVTISILDAKLDVVRTLVAGERIPKGRRVFRWDGSGDFVPRAPDGTYRVQVHLEGQHRTILLPNPIRLDTKAPEVVDAQPNRPQFSPDGDGVADFVSVHYLLSERAHVLVYFDGRRIIRTKLGKVDNTFPWFGLVDGTLLPPGTYTLSIGAVDLAGNATPVADRARVRVEIRYIALAADTIGPVAPGATFEIGVSTDAKSYEWRLGSLHGVRAGPLLHLRAPQSPGSYTVTVSEAGHSDTARVVVG